MLMVDCVEAMQRHLHLRLTGGSGWTEPRRPQRRGLFLTSVQPCKSPLSTEVGGCRPYGSPWGLASALACAPPLTLAHSGTRLPISKPLQGITSQPLAAMS
ncbi:unnamed protein product [Pleuronectes platessa]|uniref:Uncharacterized protein n=1 Tax=Pleuronectes platessa TaxID=8262 RepID=A0A9N7YYD8_PLEPL|nr:unnamed protein product [Pleuronectes platessa]